MTQTNKGSKVVNWGGYLALTVLVTLVVSVVSVRAGLWQQGLLLYAISCLVAAVLLLIFAICMALPAFADKRRSLLHRSLLVLPGSLLLLAIISAGDYPKIHDITTDIIDPPVFVAAANLRGDAMNSLEINAETLAQQKIAYPGIKTMQSHLNFDQAFAQARAVAEKMGWEITHADPQAGILEGVDTTAIMAFKDDIVIRITRTENSTLIDLRSASRVGQSDLGANAKRIREFMARYKS